MRIMFKIFLVIDFWGCANTLSGTTVAFGMCVCGPMLSYKNFRWQRAIKCLLSKKSAICRAEMCPFEKKTHYSCLENQETQWWVCFYSLCCSHISSGLVSTKAYTFSCFITHAMLNALFHSFNWMLIYKPVREPLSAAFWTICYFITQVTI